MKRLICSGSFLLLLIISLNGKASESDFRITDEGLVEMKVAALGWAWRPFDLNKIKNKTDDRSKELLRQFKKIQSALPLLDQLRLSENGQQIEIRRDNNKYEHFSLNKVKDEAIRNSFFNLQSIAKDDFNFIVSKNAVSHQFIMSIGGWYKFDLDFAQNKGFLRSTDKSNDKPLDAREIKLKNQYEQISVAIKVNNPLKAFGQVTDGCADENFTQNKIRYNVTTPQDWDFPSDHLPVMANIKIGKDEFKAMTFNVLNEKYKNRHITGPDGGRQGLARMINMDEQTRYKQLLDIISKGAESGAGIINLQEVSPEFFEKLKAKFKEPFILVPSRLAKGGDGNMLVTMYNSDLFEAVSNPAPQTALFLEDKNKQIFTMQLKSKVGKNIINVVNTHMPHLGEVELHNAINKLPKGHLLAMGDLNASADEKGLKHEKNELKDFSFLSAPSGSKTHYNTKQQAVTYDHVFTTNDGPEITRDEQFLKNIGINSESEAIAKVQAGINTGKIPPEKVYNSPDWLKTIFGEDEATLMEKYKKEVKNNPPKSFQLSEIENKYLALTAKKAPNKNKANITIVQGLDAIKLPTSSLAAGGIVQIASQFNGLEGTNPNQHSYLKDYPADKTQGPRVAMPCADALLRREALYHIGTPFNAFSDILSKNEIKKFGLEHGYVQWKQDPKSFNNYLSDENVKKLRILPMWTHPEMSADPQHRILQVPTAAPPTNSYTNGGDPEVQNEIARKLVVSQYKSLAQLAVSESIEKGTDVPLHLTLVGQGVFNNDKNIIDEALKEVEKIVEGRRVSVYVHAYDAKATQSVQSTLKNTKMMSSEQYLNHP